MAGRCVGCKPLGASTAESSGLTERRSGDSRITDLTATYSEHGKLLRCSKLDPPVQFGDSGDYWPAASLAGSLLNDNADPGDLLDRVD